jgi:hypothetical protein
MFCVNLTPVFQEKNIKEDLEWIQIVDPNWKKKNDVFLMMNNFHIQTAIYFPQNNSIIFDFLFSSCILCVNGKLVQRRIDNLQIKSKSHFSRQTLIRVKPLGKDSFIFFASQVQEYRSKLQQKYMIFFYYR